MTETAVIAATTFFATIGPIDVAAMFAALTADRSAAARRSMARRGTLIATAILLLFAVTGEALLQALGISLAALRIGWAVVPPSLVRAFQDAKALTDTGTASVEQLAFADFVAEGHLERHVRRIRRLHAGRRAALLEAVDRELGDRGTVIGTAAGLHALLRLESLSARYVTRLRAACRERGVGVYPAAPFYARPPRRAELLLGYAALSEADIRAGIRRLAQAVNELGR